MNLEPCSCHECITAGCTRPPVTLAASGRYPQRELHGLDLLRYWDGVEAKNAILRRIAEDMKKHRIHAQRGDEPR
jgi:hypothetical protein